MTKCDICNKVLTKRSPGLECRSCGKVVHASQVCSGLTAKQLSALRNAGSLDWTCDECQHKSPNRKSSFIIPEDDEEDEDSPYPSGNLGSCTIDTAKLLKDITMEMKKLLKKELFPIEASTSACNSKMDELSKTVEAQNRRIISLEKRCTYLTNEKSHMELELSSLKQLVRGMEQQHLANVIEITGIPKVQDENLNAICQKLAKTLEVDSDCITNIKRIENRSDKHGFIHVQLKQEENAGLWVRCSRIKPIVTENIVNNPPKDVAKSKVIVRRALTRANKSLLWQAQQKLRPAYKHVWFQDGKVLLRRADNDKPTVVRSEADIDELYTRVQDVGPNAGR